MEKFFLKSFLFSALLILNACSGAEVSDSSGIDSNTVISGTFSQANSSIIEGSGTIRFTSTLPNQSSRSISLKASLDSTIALSSVTAVFYSANAAVPSNEGIAVSFSRSGASVNGAISFNGNSANVTSSKLSFYFPSALDVVIEVHNVANKARVLVWRRNMVEYAAATADIDSDRGGDLIGTLPIQKGAGTFVGLILQNATVTAARVDLQKVLD